MLEITKEFYRKTKLDKAEEDDNTTEPPITYLRVFYKTYPRFPSIKLIKNDSSSELESVLISRQSYRRFKGSVNLTQLSEILLSCRIADRDREPERRTYPSAGARFPIELYVASFNIHGLKPGIYHYNILEETLELLLEENIAPIEKEIVSVYLSGAAAAIIMTSAISRSEVKYGIKAYPYSLLEAGHIGQNIILTCTRIGMGSCPVGGFVNETISRLLDLAENEIPVYVIGIGKKCDEI